MCPLSCDALHQGCLGSLLGAPLLGRAGAIWAQPWQRSCSAATSPSEHILLGSSGEGESPPRVGAELCPLLWAPSPWGTIP